MEILKGQLPAVHPSMDATLKSPASEPLNWRSLSTRLDKKMSVTTQCFLVSFLSFRVTLTRNHVHTAARSVFWGVTPLATGSLTTYRVRAFIFFSHQNWSCYFNGATNVEARRKRSVTAPGTKLLKHVWIVQSVSVKQPRDESEWDDSSCTVKAV